MNRRLRWISLALAALVLLWFFTSRGKASPPTSLTRGGASGSAVLAQEIASRSPNPSAALEVLVLGAGQPLAGARVRLYARATGALVEGAWTQLEEMSTDARGCADLPAHEGALLVAASAPGFGAARQILWRAPGSGKQRITLALEMEAQLRGVLRSARTQEPIAPGIVSVTPLDAAQVQPTADAAGTLTVAAGSDGTFSVSGIAPGRYWVDASAPGYAHEARSVLAPSAEPVVLLLRDSAFLSGIVVREDGARAANASVTALSPAAEANGVADAEGAFSLEVAPGVHELFARAGALSGRLEAPVAVKPGQTIEGLRIVVKAGTVLSGRVRSEDGQAIVGAQVSLALSVVGHSVPQAEQRSDTDGHFEFAGLGPGAYLVAAEAAGFARGETARVVLASAPRAVELMLHGAAALEGNVLEPDHAPVAEAIVQLVGDSPRETRVDTSGHYAFEGLSAGAAVVSARRPGQSIGASRSVALLAGATAHADLLLGATGRLHGTVRWRSGAAAESPMRVTASSASGDKSETSAGGVDTDAQGLYSMELNEGDYRVSARPLGWVNGFNAWTGVEVTLAAGEDRELDISLAQDGPDDGIHGQVYEPGGAPSVRPLIAAVIDGQGQRNFRAREDGSFDLPMQLNGGTVQLFAINGGRTGNSTADAQATNAIIQLLPAATLTGEVSRANGQPARSFTLEVQHPDGLWPFLDRPIDLEGPAFVLEDVAPGTIHLVATAPDGAHAEQDLSLSPGQTGRAALNLASPRSIEPRKANLAAQLVSKR